MREGERQISGHKKPVSDRHGEVQRAVGAAKLRTAVYASSSNITADPDPEIDRRPFALDCRPTSHIETEARSEEHTSELQSLMRLSYAVFCLQNTNKNTHIKTILRTTTL